MRAAGPFSVKLNPQASETEADATVLSRLTIDKQFDGDLVASSKGQMLAAGTQTKGSAGYVAIEKVTGRLNGHEGSFHLQHSATMNRGVPSLSIVVVPDSGTEGFAGLSGSMQIEIAEGKHSYVFDYRIAKD